MKRNSVLVAGLAMFLTATMGFGFSACSDDEPTPVIVTNPLDQEVYYIAGTVTDASKGLDGVTVSTNGVSATTGADGSYQLAVSKKGTYSVSFSKEGYVGISSEAVIPTDATKSSSIALDQTLVEANASVLVSPDSDAEIVEMRHEISSLLIPAGAVTNETNISITEYLEGFNDTERLSLSSVDCTPDGQEFEKPVEFKVKNEMSDAIHFADVKHFIEKDGAWVETGEAPFDAAKNAYVMELNGFSKHSARANSSKKDNGTSTEDLSTVEVNNLGQMDAVDRNITAMQKSGWEIEGDLSSQISGQFSGLGQSDIAGLSSALNRAIACSQGCVSGVKETEISLGDARISGDTKMTVNLKTLKKTTTMTFLISYQGREIEFSVNVVSYLGIVTEISYEYGEHRTDHSGSSIR